MLTTLYYCFQVILCSTIMMGYYWLVLRDKKFHQYNRFYLMAIAVLSWIVPLIKIQWQHAVEADSTIYYLLSSVASNNTDIDLSLQSKWYNLNWQALLTVTYISVSLILLTGMVSALVRIYRLLKNNSCKSLGEVFVVLTNANGTPFSFFNYIFWNDAIDLKSESGKQILQHELTHVKQKHSIDKILIQLVLIVGWFNPFFWLIKKEMDMIHEFIADQHTIENGDAASLAEMLLTAVYPQQKYLLANPFFFSPIKRRIQMMKNNSNPKYSYMRRLIILPLLAIVVVLFAFRNKENAKPVSINSMIENLVDVVNKQNRNTTKVKDTTILSGDSVYVVPGDKKITIISPNGINSFSSSGKADFSKEKMAKFGLAGAENTVYYLDGKKVDNSVLNEMNPNAINNVTVLKGASAVALYGEEGKNGVVEITSKKEYLPEGGKISMNGSNNLVLVGKSLSDTSQNIPLYIIDGKILPQSSVNSISPSSIKSINVVKGETAVKVYGKAAYDGIIEITTYKNVVRGIDITDVKLEKVTNSKDDEAFAYGNRNTISDVKLERNTNKDFSTIIKKIKSYNSEIRFVFFEGGYQLNRLNIQFKDGTEEIYNLENAESRNRAEKKYGIKLVPPPQVNRKLNGNNSTAKELPVVNVQLESLSNKKIVEGEPLVKEEKYDKVFTVTQVQASFPGGKDAWQKYLEKNLKSNIPVEKGAPAGKYTVIIDFIVKADGSLTDLKIANNPGYGTGEEALRMISKGPKWVPAIQNGRAVTSKVKQNITFQITED